MLKKILARLVQICCLCLEKGTDYKQLAAELFLYCDLDDMPIGKYYKDCVICGRKKLGIRHVFSSIFAMKHRLETGR